MQLLCTSTAVILPFDILEGAVNEATMRCIVVLGLLGIFVPA